MNTFLSQIKTSGFITISSTFLTIKPVFVKNRRCYIWNFVLEKCTFIEKLCKLDHIFKKFCVDFNYLPFSHVRYIDGKFKEHVAVYIKHNDNSQLVMQ